MSERVSEDTGNNNNSPDNAVGDAPHEDAPDGGVPTPGAPNPESPPDAPPRRKRGRPKGSKDKRKRAPVNQPLLSSELVAQGKVPNKRDMLFMREIEQYGFKTGWEFLSLLKDLLVSLDEQKKKNGGILPIDKQINERVWQAADLLKTVMKYQFTPMKAYEPKPNMSERVIFNFNLSKDPGRTSAAGPEIPSPQEVSEVLDLLKSDGGRFKFPFDADKDGVE